MPRQPRSRPVAFLVHGQYLNRLSLWPLARKLRRAGFEAHLVAHDTVRGRLDDSARRLSEAVAAALARRPSTPAVLIGHSLGGLVAAHALSRHPAMPVKALILLGSPFQGSEAARGANAIPTLGALVGRPVLEWANRQPAELPPHVAVHVLAGTTSLGMGRLFRRFEGANDGTVSVGETRVPGSVASVEMAESHSGMLFSAGVAQQVVRWMAAL